jgi:ATP-binding cassette subfamily F protein uup
VRAAGPPSRLSYRERLEFDALPARLEALEAERARLEATIGAAEFYKEAPPVIAATLERLDAVGLEIDAAYRRWDELDSRTR